MNNIFITGISGFAGSNLARHLGGLEGYRVTGHSRYFKETAARLGAHVMLQETISAHVFNAGKIDTVIHLAGIAHDLSNRYSDDDYLKVNFENTKSVFDDFISSDARKFIFLSSIKAVVEDALTPVQETVEAHPGTAYGRSKRMAEEYILSKSLPHGKSAYIFRPCMIHGVGNKGNLNLLYQYASSGMPYPLGSFKNQRSFLNMDNLNFIVQQTHEMNLPSGIYHLADDGALSTRELFEIIATTLKRPALIWNMPERLIRIIVAILGRKRTLAKLTESLVVSNAKISHAIGKPLPVSIRNGIVKTIESFDADKYTA